jgi:hypothetical protein
MGRQPIGVIFVCVVTAMVCGCRSTPAKDKPAAPAKVETPAPPAPQAAAQAEPVTPDTRGDRTLDFRRSSPRVSQTIFDPLSLPTPGTVRNAAGAPGPDYWQQRVDYSIEASLDAEKNRITGREVVTYTNNSPDPLPYLWIHLEQNLFRPDSLGTLTTPPSTRFANRGDFVGGFEITGLRVASPSGTSLAGSAPGADIEYHVYDTLARLDLPAPIPAKGGAFAFEVEWSFTIPQYGSDRMGMRSGNDGTVYELAQWFPAAAVYDDVYGWNTLPYLGQGEFYTNFGSYDVRLTVPRSHLVACTGVLQNPEEVLTTTQQERLARARASAETVVIRAEEEVKDAASRPAGDGPLTWHFKADDVRTVAWASSAAFLWDASFLETTGPGGKGTLVQSMYPGEAIRAWTKSTEMLRAAIDGYSKRWFPYPYPVATNINGVAGGMEYPMIIFCGGRGSADGLFGVTTHEIGHNWFPMTVNSDERRHAWMDEGFNTFINFYSWQDWRGGDTAGRRGNARPFARSMRSPNQQPMETFADRILPSRLGGLEYEKTAVGLVLLREQVLGPERFDRAFREYVRRWAFKSPQPADFFRTIENVAGMDLAWFWRGWVLETGTLDQAVESVSLLNDGKRARVTFANLGELVMPVVFKVTYEDGSSDIRRLPVEIWHYTNRWTTQFDTGGKAVTEVVVDPEQAFPDVDARNNTWKRPEPAPLATPAPAPPAAK